ncbi:MAG: type II toxin-antitoxin system RelE/ParE family toxin [Prolixibacteraceae bacterium]|jgi:toxin ParE1/3/4|nr:type II toxin-antitoxin system RelE/ParE family toxin [Prolixibacteraceae bacterium]
MVKIVWTELSLFDLKEIYDYIAANSQRYATITTNKIYQRVQIIADNPYTGKIVDEFNEKSIRELIEGKYRIIYRIKTNYQVDILRIYHSARLLKRNKID